MADIKITKRDTFEDIIRFVKGEDMACCTPEQIIEMCEKEIASLDKRSARAKERAEIEKAANDELADKVFALLTSDFQTIADIAAQFDDEDVTTSKIQYRLTKLVEYGKAIKTQVEIPATETSKKRTLNGYARA